ncbi:MAG: hypothetical protein A2836_01990 [Candidatus Taylorbacteria bacterium RIFCSPHIGHO2_01_FULL_45_63]|uniref:Uncharacterized protein n=1 Tax=Candidatus Taylorbacteria bacterium RIFCSPHIGHO2_02_FULL_45_35 TaxID=1802311 RepID=A0A1G2MW21_9BACT|nr:MAG: hypothetical protein A2836_01990 [Candidatus Taylorbacteria bacterium RIFCSPHIGHO2_01_FULL_45_63]OHA27449.1 MAG: hypothetical protein A3D56_00635 [Candidatus Taylorbacteria bacterium RIFCSPHIGHO2_02_FULL_45_35]OHA34488.1 MAG: hypothetical protein A3A22_02640 [Candidatus Taylorbacteria bacterium RIFCSPLOWO2_01_FULL_45_34b]
MNSPSLTSKRGYIFERPWEKRRRRTEKIFTKKFSCLSKTYPSDPSLHVYTFHGILWLEDRVPPRYYLLTKLWRPTGRLESDYHLNLQVAHGGFHEL